MGKKIKKLNNKEFRKSPKPGYDEKNPKSKKDAHRDRPGTKFKS